ncbi:hypothetical protein [Nonomuraea sp. SBT364]|uniref:hypothetical protein n=1 Tax=Nonomuraea sp. SBT364 TaxID=1580530 RepID=UPI00066A9338|nr:hypothetical protein [Nonomuraea sp. SBT364]
MTKHTISAPTGTILGDSYACDCGVPLAGRMAAELHAAENQLCTACLGSAQEELAPGLTHGCPSCAGTGGRREQMTWQLAHAEAEERITITMVRGVVSGFDGPFRLSDIADTIRDGLRLPAGRLPVGPRVRDLLLEMQMAGEITMLSAPDELLDGTDVVLYRDPQWQRAGTLGL